MITPSEGQAPSSISSTFVVREGQLTLGNANAFAADCTATIKLLGSAAVTAAEGVPIVLDGTITFAPDTGVLKLTGDVRSNGKVKLELSSLKSIRSLIDLSSATTTLTADDFEIVGNVPPPVRIAIQNGMLRAWRNVSTVLFFR